MENLKIFKKNTTKVEIEKIKESSSSLLGFFGRKSKKDIVDICLYKSDAIIALSDSSLIVYDIIRESQTLEINDLVHNNYQVTQLCFIPHKENYLVHDLLVCVCQNNLIFMNLGNFETLINLELSHPCQKLYVEFLNKTYRFLVVHKSLLSIYVLVLDKKTSKLKFRRLYEFNTTEVIQNKNVYFSNNIIMCETKNKINVYKLDYTNELHRNYSVFKKDLAIYKSENFLNDPKEKDNPGRDLLLQVTFNFSKLTNCFYFTIYNKIYLIKNSYSEIFLEELEILEKITKQSNILFTRVEDPYMLIIIENKLYVYFITDLTKCLEIIELDCLSNLNNLNISQINCFTKDLFLLKNINKLNYETNLIQFPDIVHMNRIKYLPQSDFDYILNSCQFILFFFNSKFNRIDWIYMSNIESQVRFLKSVNFNFSSKLLSYYSEGNSKLPESELKQTNQKFFLKKNLESFCYLISSQDYPKAKFCIDECQMDLIYVSMLLKKFFSSKNLTIILNYIYRSNIGEFYKLSLSSLSASDLKFNLNRDLEEFENLLSIAMLKNEKELSMFLKTFFNRYISSRNEIKLKIDKEKRKKINLDEIMKSIMSIEDKIICENEIKFEIENSNFSNYQISPHDEEMSFVNRNFLTIQEKLKSLDVTETDLRYCLIENLVFIFHFYSYRLSKSSKYSDNLKLIIKISHNLLDKELISLLKGASLEEEVLLFYYYKGNYAKCISNIINIYESLCKVKEEDFTGVINKNSSISNSVDEDFSLMTNSNKENDENSFHSSIPLVQPETRSLEKTKKQWLTRYINLISLISEKLTQVEFFEYLKWALSKNPIYTIEILFDTNKISKEKLDLEFINLLKLYGIDPVIFYLKKFLKNNQASDTTHHNEMINLYIIKLKLLQEALDKENPSSTEIREREVISEYYKWNKKILKTREEFCNYLIDQNLYDLDFSLEKIKSIDYLSVEYGIVLFKQNNIEEGLYKIFYGEFPSKMKILKKLIKCFPYFEVVYISLKHIITNYFKNPTELNKLINNSEMIPIEEIIIDLLHVIKTEYELIYSLCSLDIFHGLKIEKFLFFFVHVLSNLDSASKNHKIETALMESKYINTYSDLIDIQNTKIVIDNKSSCEICNKGFFNSQVVFVYPKSIYHYDCYPGEQ